MGMCAVFNVDLANARRMVLLAAVALTAACDPYNVRGSGVVDIQDAKGLAELRTVIEAVQTAVVETQDAFPVQPHEGLAKTVEAQCKNARVAASAECENEFQQAGEACKQLTGVALEARCTARLTVADRNCLRAERRLQVASLCAKVDALAGVSIRKATLSLETVGTRAASGGLKFFVINIGGGKTAKNAQRLELVFTPVPEADPTGPRAEALGLDVDALNALIGGGQARDAEVRILSRQDFLDRRKKLVDESQARSLAPEAEQPELANAERLITFIREAAQAASIEKIGDKEAPLLTNTFTVAFTFEVTQEATGGLEWELTPHKAGFSAGRTAAVGNQLVLEFGQPE